MSLTGSCLPTVSVRMCQVGEFRAKRWSGPLWKFEWSWKYSSMKFWKLRSFICFFALMTFFIMLHLFIVASAEIMRRANDEKLFYRETNWKFIYGNYRLCEHEQTWSIIIIPIQAKFVFFTHTYHNDGWDNFEIHMFLENHDIAYSYFPT